MNRLAGEKVSVCLLTYNHVDVVESTLRSILEQTLVGYEVIVSDDCSTDGTWRRILELAATEPRIKPVQTPHNMGMAGNANFAVGQSRRPYIALLHHDDLYRQDLLEKWTELIERHADIAFVFNSYGVHESSHVYSEAIPAGRVDGRWLLENYLFPRWGCAVRGTTMVRREIWEQVGGMRERFGLLADIDLWMRLSMRWAVGYVPEPVIVVRHQRPSYYPDIYTGKSMFWRRLAFLYEIHATNRQEYYELDTLIGRWNWWLFRIRLSLETGKWLAYAAVRRRFDMIETSADSETEYDLLPLRLIRSALRWALARRSVEKP